MVHLTRPRLCDLLMHIQRSAVINRLGLFALAESMLLRLSLSQYRARKANDTGISVRSGCKGAESEEIRLPPENSPDRVNASRGIEYLFARLGGKC